MAQSGSCLKSPSVLFLGDKKPKDCVNKVRHWESRLYGVFGLSAQLHAKSLFLLLSVSSANSVTTGRAVPKQRRQSGPRSSSTWHCPLTNHIAYNIPFIIIFKLQPATKLQSFDPCIKLGRAAHSPDTRGSRKRFLAAGPI